MAKVTKETMKTLLDAGVFPPRHRTGCPKNLARMLPLLYAATGMSVDQIKDIVWKAYNSYSCTCK